MSFETLLFDVQDHVARVTLNRPDAGNAMNAAMMSDLCYVAIRCDLNHEEQPLWQADNTVPLDGAIPWGQDVVEILLDPHNTHQGTGDDIYCLQIKPSGLLVARQGCLTDPPMNHSELWQSGTHVAVSLQPEAWIVEVAVPLASLGRAAFSWRSRSTGCSRSCQS